MIADIHRALFADVAEFAVSENITVAFPNVDFAPGDSTYLRVDLLFAATENIGFDIVNQPGILQVSVMYRDGTGVVAAAQIADALILHFYRNRRINAGSVCVLFNSAGYISPPLVSNGWLMMPVSFNFKILL